jgi:hypothetical protein
VSCPSSSAGSFLIRRGRAQQDGVGGRDGVRGVDAVGRREMAKRRRSVAVVSLDEPLHEGPGLLDGID